MGSKMKSEEGVKKVSEKVKKTIETIKEIVGNHSDNDIYFTLQQTNMDPNETTQKLLNQDPFHEVRRRRDKKKENAGYAHVEPRKHAENGQGGKLDGYDRNARSRGSYGRSPAYDSGLSREFRVVRDNRVNENSHQEAKAFSHIPSSTNAQRINNVSERSSSRVPNNQRRWGGRYSQNPNGVRGFRPKITRDMNSDTRSGHYEKKSSFTSSETQVMTMESNNLNSLAGSAAYSNDVGVYASASDPVHDPSNSRSSAAIGTKRCDLGVVGSWRKSSDNSSKQSIQQSLSNSNVNSVLGSSATESFRLMSSAPQNEQTHANAVDSVVVNSTGNRSSSHFGTRSHPQSVAHQKGALPGKEWKPKTNQKSSTLGPGVIGSPVKSVSHLNGTSNNPENGTEQLQEKLSHVNIQESQNVIIAQHIRVSENDRSRLTFGTFGLDSDDTENSVSAFQAADSIEEPIEPSYSNQQLNSVDEQVQNSGSSTPSGASSENPSPDDKESCSISNPVGLDEMGLVRNSPSLTTSKSQQHQESIELPNFTALDQQPVYDMSYFRPSIDVAVRGSGLPSPQEAISSHTANSIPTSAGMLQQQAPMATMYPQVHLSHFANVMPYRQYLPPLYVPPVVPGFSGNPGYPHLSSGNSYVLMPGGGSHVPANSLKYGVQQFKPFPAGSPTGFVNLTNPSGYAVNAPGVVGGPMGLDDSSRLKYKDNNLYVPNPQAETSEVWIQNHRDLSGMQSNPYYNMQGQTAHPAYLQSHTGHASFNGSGVAQTSQMQFPGMYPPQPAGIPNAHHLGGGNMGVGVAPPTPGAQVGAYQQPQMSPLHWTPNF